MNKLNQPDVETKSILSYESAYEYLLGLLELEDDIKWPLVKQSMQRFKELIDLHSQPEPTIEEVKKEWEDDGWEWKEGGIYIELIKNNEDYNIEISIDKIDKTYCCFEDDDCDQTSLRITFKEHIRLTKTFRALKWEV